jgi:hypothetical protein
MYRICYAQSLPSVLRLLIGVTTDAGARDKDVKALKRLVKLGRKGRYGCKVGLIYDHDLEIPGKSSGVHDVYVLRIDCQCQRKRKQCCEMN